MSWGAGASEGASAAGSTAASNTASTAGSAAGSSGSGVLASSASEGAGSTFNTAATNSGWGIEPASEGGYVNMTSEQSANMSDYGSANPSGWDKAMSNLDQFQQGSKQSMGEAYKNRGNNPRTYGYIAGKMQGFAGGGGNQPANVTTNINYQQPENDYLRRRRGY